MQKRDFLAYVARMVRIEGRFVRKDRDDGGTAEAAYWMAAEAKEDSLPSADDFQDADEALAYATRIPSDASQFSQKVRAACAKEGDVAFSQVNLIAAILDIAIRGSEDANFQALGADSVHLDKKNGEEVTLPKVRVVQMRTITLGRFDRNIVKVLTPDGNILTWWASKMPSVRVGGTYRFHGRVKGPSEYQGVLETLVTRCQFGIIPA